MRIIIWWFFSCTWKPRKVLSHYQPFSPLSLFWPQDSRNSSAWDGFSYPAQSEQPCSNCLSCLKIFLLLFFRYQKQLGRQSLPCSWSKVCVGRDEMWMGRGAASTAESWQGHRRVGGKDDIVATARKRDGHWMYQGASSLLGSPSVGVNVVDKILHLHCTTSQLKFCFLSVIVRLQVWPFFFLSTTFFVLVWVFFWIYTEFSTKSVLLLTFGSN